MLEFTESGAVAGRDAPWREAIPKRPTVRMGGLVQVRLSTRPMRPSRLGACLADKPLFVSCR